MPSEDLRYLSIAEVAGRIRRKDLSPVEVTRAALERVERLNSRLNSFITVLGDQALAAARRAEQEIQRGDYRGPLHGVPIGLKDLFWTKGIRTTCGSRILADFVPQEDSTVAARLKEAGAILLGKLHMHEFAYGPTGTNPHYGDGRNPWDTERLPGGSSSGSGSAVAAGLVYGAMGTDTGGSVRIPASLCGIVGLKPTYGRVSRFGVAPLSWSLDHAGPMARTVEDCAIMLNAIAGHDPRDHSSAQVPVPDYTRSFTGEGQPDLAGLRLGVPRELFFDGLQEDVRRAVHRAIAVLEERGATTQEVSIPLLNECASMSSGILLPEATAYHLPYLRTRAGEYAPDVRARLELGALLPATAYIKAQRARGVFIRQFREVLRRVDAVVCPGIPIVAPPIGVSPVEARGTLTALTRPFNLTGMPAITLPCGFSSEGLPIALQVAGRHFDEAMVLRVAHAYEVGTEWHLRRPLV